jgi:hypothetical protein
VTVSEVSEMSSCVIAKAEKAAGQNDLKIIFEKPD